MNKANERRAVVLSREQIEALERYAATKHITRSEAIRQFVEQGLSLESYKQQQTEIRKYIREEIETVLPNIIKPYMERLIKMQANATRTSAAGLMSTISVIADNYIDTTTPEEILARALKLSTHILKTRPKSDEEYLAEAHEWLSADLSRPNDV